MYGARCPLHVAAKYFFIIIFCYIYYEAAKLASLVPRLFLVPHVERGNEPGDEASCELCVRKRIKHI